MKITTKGQVTIPQYIRERLGLLPHTEVEWELGERVAVLRKGARTPLGRGKALIEHMRGRGAIRMSTDDIIALTRGDL
jgi:AbrB family looped-hinge helix DNA binding protein